MTRKSRPTVLPTAGHCVTESTCHRHLIAKRRYSIAFLAMVALLLVLVPALAYATNVPLTNRPTWRPPPTPGLQDNLISMKRIDDWQVTCYQRAFVMQLINACELRLHERQFATGHSRAQFVFDMVIEVAHPDTARRGKRGVVDGQDDTMIEPTDVYDFNILLAATPTPSWAEGSLRVGDFQMRISDVCLVGDCILRHSAAERLIIEMLDAKAAVGIIQFQDAPLSQSFQRRRLTVPLAGFDRALNLLIEQTQIHSGY